MENDIKIDNNKLIIQAVLVAFGFSVGSFSYHWLGSKSPYSPLKLTLIGFSTFLICFILFCVPGIKNFKKNLKIVAIGAIVSTIVMVGLMLLLWLGPEDSERVFNLKRDIYRAMGHFVIYGLINYFGFRIIYLKKAKLQNSKAGEGKV